MTFTTTFYSLRQNGVSKGAISQFHTLGLYRFGLLFAVIDFLDIYDFLESYLAVKYCYAMAVLAFMFVYFVRWRDIYPSFAPIVFLLFFTLTGAAFATRFVLFGEKNSYISAFIAPLIFSATIFIPSNVLVFDARKVVRDLAIVFSIGTLFFVLECLIKPLYLVSGAQDAIQFIKSTSSLLTVCLAILCGNTFLVAIAGMASAASLALRPSSTLVLALVSCLPIAVALRFRVKRPRLTPLLIARPIAMLTLALAISVPLLLYFFFDEVAPQVVDWEDYLKGQIGGVSNVEFRLQILKLAFTAFDNASFWYGSALAGSQSVPLAQAWQWWLFQSTSGEATIHSDFVIVLTLTGVLGYALFCAAFYSVLKTRFLALRRRSLNGYGVVIQSISIVSCIALLVYSSAEPYLTYYSHTNLIWTLLFISEVARKSKVIC